MSKKNRKNRGERPKRGETATTYHRQSGNMTVVFFLVIIALLVLSLLPRS